MNNPPRLLWLLPAAALLGWWLARPGRRKGQQTATTEQDGVGPVTVRRYWLDVQNAKLPPEELLQTVLNNFPRLMPRPYAFVWKTQGHPGVGQRGDQYFLLLFIRRAMIETELVEPLRFRNRTLRPHPESGWVQFQVIPSAPQHYRLEVQSSVRTSTPADRLAYLLGMAGVQARVWHTVLHRAQRLSGGKAIQAGRHTQETPGVPGGTKAPKTRHAES